MSEATPRSEAPEGTAASSRRQRRHRVLTGEWVVDRSTARQRRTIHYWLTLAWLTIGSVFWIVLRDALWFVGFMSLYAIWISHLTGWSAETPVEEEDG